MYVSFPGHCCLLFGEGRGFTARQDNFTHFERSQSKTGDPREKTPCHMQA